MHLSREEPWRTGSARDIPPLTGDEVRVRTGRRMFGGKRVVQAAGEPVIGQRSCCVKLIESQQLEAVFLFRYSSINYRGYICFLKSPIMELGVDVQQKSHLKFRDFGGEGSKQVRLRELESFKRSALLQLRIFC